MAKKFSSELDPRGTVKVTDKLMIQNIDTGAVEYTTVAELLKALSTFAAGQIGFPATQIPSSNVNTLDDYEEGVWTPGYTGSTGTAGSIAYSEQTGKYVKIGQMVFLNGCIILTNNGDWTGDVRITGLPFNSGGTSGWECRGAIELRNITFDGYAICEIGRVGATFLSIIISKTASSYSILPASAVSDNSSFLFSICYKATT